MTTTTSDHIHRLKFKAISNIWDAIELGSIRNECREFMTRDTSKIGLLRQLRWYYTNYKKDLFVVAYLVQMADTGLPVGYALINSHGKKVLLSGGLKKNFRGQKLGEELFSHLTELVEQSGEQVALEVLPSNKVAFKLYLKLGFKRISSKNGVIYMEKRYE